MTKEGIKVLKPAELYTHTHTHTQLKRCRDFLCKLCLGAVLIFAPIFSFATTLPSGYTELEYIESTGTQYIDTDFVYDNNTRVVWDIQLTATLPLSINNASGVGYYRTNYERLGFGFEASNQKILLFKANASGDTRLQTINVDNNRHIIEINSPNNKGYVDGVEYTFNSAVGQINNSANISLPIFAWYSNSVYQSFLQAKLYSTKIWDNGTLARDLIPAKRNSDNVVGLYDTVNGVFYTNSGTGTFIAGPAVSSCGYTELEYLELQGEAYFNTNVYLSKDMDIEFELMPTQLVNVGWFSVNRSVSYSGFMFSYNKDNVISGTSHNDTNIDFFGSATTARWVVQNGGSKYVLENNKKYNLSIINKVGTFSVDGTVIDTHTYVADGISPMTTPLYINARTWNGEQTIVYENGDLHVRFYHFSATGVADIVPVKRDCDNVLGLYNKTTGEFLEKIGSGTLVAGPVVGATVEQGCEYTRLEYLKSSNTQYIQDDSFQTIGTGAIEIKTKDLQTYTRFAGWDGLVALATPNSATNYFPFLYGSWDDYNPNPVSIAAENALRYEFEPGLQKLYVNGVLNRQAQKNTSIYSAPFRMFIVSTGGGYNHGSTIYYCRVYDGNDVLLRNYIPVRRNSDNVLGMYDTVTKTFFTNAGTGTFIAGPELAWGNNCSVTINITWGGLAEPDASGMCTYGETFTAPSTAPTAPSGLKFLGWRPIGQ